MYKYNVGDVVITPEGKHATVHKRYDNEGVPHYAVYYDSPNVRVVYVENDLQTAYDSETREHIMDKED